MGRTGKILALRTWLKWVDKPAIMKIIANTYEYTAEYIDPEAPNGKRLTSVISWILLGFEEFKSGH